LLRVNRLSSAVDTAGARRRAIGRMCHGHGSPADATMAPPNASPGKEHPMKRIDEARLESDPDYRFEYLSEFMSFTAEDVAVIHGAVQHLAPLVPALVDAVYVKLFSYDATRKPFLPRQAGYQGPVPTSVEELTLDHEMIQFRKQHLGRYLERLVTKPYDASMVKYLDMVGRIHTAKAGNPEIQVPLVHMNALLGFVADAITNVIFGLGLPRQSEIAAVRAFNKLLWIQNDLINRHYQQDTASR
jgi:hypothetical protein